MKKTKSKKKKKSNTEIKIRQMLPCLTNLRSVCCNQVRKTTTFKSQQTKKNIPQRQLCQQLCYIFDGGILCNK